MNNHHSAVEDVLADLRAYVEASDYAGWDPYDALNSPLLRLLSCRSKWLRIAFTQALRRSPVNPRRLLGVRKGHNPKGIGLLLEGYSKLYAVAQDPRLLPMIDHLLSLLESLRSTNHSGNCWGYNFDWQSRAAFVPKHTPTIVNSAFIGHALLDCFEATGAQKALDLAQSIPDFILTDLNRKHEGDSFCFSYTPSDENYVHNANLLGASLLIRIATLAERSEWRDPALASLAYSMKHQHADGSWYYAEPDMQHWIDSFHTGFNLEALRWFLRLGEGEPYRESFCRGVAYYATTFFLADGTPKYYHDRTYPIDIHAPAEAICFFAGEPGYEELTETILKWTLANMWNERKSCFHFRKHPRHINRIPYMRWSQSWGFRALVQYQKSNPVVPGRT